MQSIKVLLKYGKDIIILYLFFGLIAVLPQIGKYQGINLRRFIIEYFNRLYMYTINLFQGSLGEYYIGNRIRLVGEDIWLYAFNSFKLLVISLVLGMVLGIIFGVFIAVNRKRSNVGQGSLMLLSSIPDFILILLLQILVIMINEFVGQNIINIASFGDKEAILLPIISMIIIPMVFLINGVIKDTSLILTEEYIRTAVAKGLSKATIIKHHILSNLLVHIKTDLSKMISISIANLFIVEYLYNTRGITRFIFFLNQYPVWMSGFILIAIMYITIYLILSFSLNVIRGLLVGE